jgi:predicted RNA binding protein YcfA (HicA-like mRNA interferase family)
MNRLPSVRPREIVVALKRDGFLEHHQKGSHLFLWHPMKLKMTTVPMHAKDLKRPLLKEILKQASLSEDEFRGLL